MRGRSSSEEEPGSLSRCLPFADRRRTVLRVVTLLLEGERERDTRDDRRWTIGASSSEEEELSDAITRAKKRVR